MKLAPSSFAANPHTFEDAKTKFAKGEALILEVGSSHDEKAISHFLSSPNFQKDVAVGVGVGGVTGVLVGVVVDQITQANPAAGIVGKLLLGIIGGVVGGIVAKEAAAVANQTPAGLASTGRKVLPPAVDITYDPQAGHLFAQLMQQTTK
jgi:F0F1-type ATP synthase assembly protein I